MKYCYTREPVGDYTQRNPLYWSQSTPPSDASEVLVDDGFPEILEYFGELVVDVTKRAVERADFMPTRDEISKMPAKEVAEWLEAHGVEGPEGKLKELRSMLTHIIYSEL